MEGGQKVQVPLDAGLDVHSSDMLVPVQEPKFQHNRQRFQGKYMPSSLRFEHDGWAAGWHVYQFKVHEYSVPTEPAGLEVSRQKLNSNNVYLLNIVDADGRRRGTITYASSNQVIYYDTESAAVSNGKITGVLNGKEFTVTVSPADLTHTPTLKGHNMEVESYSVASNGNVDIGISDLDTEVSLNFKGASLPSDMTNGDYTLAEFNRYVDGKSMWSKDGLEFDVKEDKMSVVYDGEVVVEDVKVTDTVNDGVYEGSFAELTFKHSFADTPQIQVTEFYPFFHSINVAAFSSTVKNGANDKLPFNVWSVSGSDILAAQNSKPADRLYYNKHGKHGFTSLRNEDEFNKQTIVQKVPVWFGIHAKNLGYVFDKEKVEDNKYIKHTNSSSLATASFSIESSKLDGSNVSGILPFRSYYTDVSKLMSDDYDGKLSGYVWLMPKFGFSDDGYGWYSDASGNPVSVQSAGGVTIFEHASIAKFADSAGGVSDGEGFNNKYNVTVNLGNTFNVGLKVRSMFMAEAYGAVDSGSTVSADELGQSDVYTGAMSYTAYMGLAVGGDNPENMLCGVHVVVPNGKGGYTSLKDLESSFSDITPTGDLSDVQKEWVDNYAPLYDFETHVFKPLVTTKVKYNYDGSMSYVLCYVTCILTGGKINAFEESIDGSPVGIEVDDTYIGEHVPEKVELKYNSQGKYWTYTAEEEDESGNIVTRTHIVATAGLEVVGSKAALRFMDMFGASLYKDSTSTFSSGTFDVVNADKSGWLAAPLHCDYNKSMTLIGYNLVPRTVRYGFFGHKKKTVYDPVPVYALSGYVFSGGGLKGGIGTNSYFGYAWRYGPGTNDAIGSGVICWCAYGRVASDLCMSGNVDTVMLYNTSEAFKIEKHNPTNSKLGNDESIRKEGVIEGNVYSGYIWLDDSEYGTNMFTHKIGSIGYNNGLMIQVCLCAVSAGAYMYYGIPDMGQSGGIAYATYAPKHFVTGDIKDVGQTNGNLNAYVINKTYSGGSYGQDYGFIIQVTGQSLLTGDDKYYNYMSHGAIPMLSKDKMLPGDSFSEEVWPSIRESFSYDISDWNGYYSDSPGLNVNVYKENECFINHSQIIRVQLGDDTNYKFALIYELDSKRMRLAKWTGKDKDKGEYVPVGNDESVTYTYVLGDETYVIAAKLNLPSDGDIFKDMRIVHTLQLKSPNYRLSFKRPWLLESISYGTEYTDIDSRILLLSLMSGKITLSSGGRMYRLDMDKLTLEISRDGTLWQYADTKVGDKYAVNYSYYDLYLMQVVTWGVIGTTTGVTVKGLDLNRMTFELDGNDYSFDVSKHGLFVDRAGTLSYYCTDTRTAKLEEKCFQEVQSDSEMQFLKQQWDTDASTECFWWIDDKHILTLTQSEFILKEKTDRLTDWDGDEFAEVWRKRRSDYITSGTPRYLCSCAYGGDSACFITIESSPQMAGIRIKVYDPLDKMSSWYADVPLNNVTVGHRLNDKTDRMNTYANIIVDSLVSQAEYTATCVDGKLLLGVHMDNNFQQWTLVFGSDNRIEKAIQGYGFVGLDGALTGGELPVDFCDEYGFSGTVEPLDVLSDTSTDVSSVEELQLTSMRVVGDDSQQWYICKKISGIVSHWTYDLKGHNFVRHTLPLSNNYAALYDSGSFYSTLYSHYHLNSEPFKDLIADGGAKGALTAVLVTWLWPILYYVAPRMTVGGYLQQTLGQAAYVHYNSTSAGKQKDTSKENRQYNHIGGYSAYTNGDNGLGIDTEEYETEYDEDRQKTACLSDELSFDRQSFKQEVTCPDPYDSALARMAAPLATVADMLQDTLSVNKMMNMVSNPGEIGKNFTQHFLQNMNSMAASSMQMKAMNATLNSEVTALKTLDMFYSTSDGQKVCAGPGYVNHNFVAMCVAQSVTSTQTDMFQQQFVYAIKALTMFPIQTAYNVAQAVTEALRQGVSANGGAGISGGGMVVIAPLGWPAALAIYAGYAVARAAATVLEAGVQWVDSMVDALTGGQMNSSFTAALTKHTYDVEYKHRYGRKDESFMWPCYGCSSKASITDESVEVVSQNKSWKLNIELESPVRVVGSGFPRLVTHKEAVGDLPKTFNGSVPYYIAMTKGKRAKVTLPDNMAYVIGAESILPDIEFRNENIENPAPTFREMPIQDYMVNEAWQLGFTASDGMVMWTSCKDTKVIDGAPSNMVVSDSFCGVASQYCAVEVKRGVQKKYLRPWAVTPDALALNCTGLNACYDGRAYHAFDGYGYRIVSWVGAPGLNKDKETWQYSFIANDRFKRSNIMPHNRYLGNFTSDPVLAMEASNGDRVASQVVIPSEARRERAYVFGENRDMRRYAVPVFSEPLSTLPAVLRTVASYALDVDSGVTGLTSRNRQLSTFYKVPESVDFSIGKAPYRYTREYICALKSENGQQAAFDAVPCLGLEFLGATPYEAYLYSPATRQYYCFTGGTSLQVVDMVERFRDITYGRYDFVNQEVLMPCLATFDRLDRRVKDDGDETDNVLVARLKDQQFNGEVWPPTEALFNTRSWFRTVSVPAGVVFQGPNRCAINRFVLSDYMVEQVKSNYGKWKRVPREEYHPFREYAAKYEWVDEEIGDDLPKGWTHNPFLLVTAPLGVGSETDCVFEWEVTFAWPVEMDKLYGPDNYAVVNLQSETMTPGGKVVADRPTHVYLTKELFTRTGNYGYYSFRYQGRCGAGNRERLHIWSDQYVCVSGLQLEFKPVTQKRTEQLTQQVDVRGLREL